tara:strand:+ start:879 stop:1520 length:642 start_codon:yes stop_codon:yes gene_type:complete
LLTFLWIALAILIISTFFLFKFSLKKWSFFFYFTYILISSGVLYLLKGNLDSFSYDYKLDKEVQGMLSDPEKFASIEPKKIIYFLENKLKKKSDDLDGWMLLARTCFLSGHIQKAELYYNQAIKYFPNNVNVLYELAMLRKNTNQLQSASNVLEKIYKIDSLHLSSIKLHLNILKSLKNKKNLSDKIKKLKNNNNLDKNWLKNVFTELNLQNF